MDRAEQLGKERVPALLLRFSIPAIIGMLVQALYNVVDRIFVGHGVGPEGIAGLTVVFPVMLVIGLLDANWPGRHCLDLHQAREGSNEKRSRSCLPLR